MRHLGRTLTGSRLAASFAAAFLVTAAMAATASPAAASVFVTGGPIAIPDVDALPPDPATEATPYPATVTAVPDGVVTGVRVLLSGLDHPFPDEIDAVLVGPQGQTTMLMSDAGAGAPGGPIDLTFTDVSLQPIPVNVVSGTYRPTDIDDGSSDAFPPPAPAAPYGTQLSPFEMMGAGEWKLFVVDDTPLDGGTIDNWSLLLSTRAFRRVTAQAPVGTFENAGVAHVVVTRTDPGLPGAVQVSTSGTPPSTCATATAGADYVPVTQTVTFAAGEIAEAVDIPLVDDSVFEGCEAIPFTISSPTGDARILGGTDTRAVRIEDDDPRPAPPRPPVVQPPARVAAPLIRANAARPLLAHGYAVDVTVRAAAGGSLVAGGSIAIRGSARRLHLATTLRPNVRAGVPVKIRLKVRAGERRTAARLLRAHKRMTAQVWAQNRSAAGAVSPLAHATVSLPARRRAGHR